MMYDAPSMLFSFFVQPYYSVVLAITLLCMALAAVVEDAPKIAPEPERNPVNL